MTGALPLAAAAGIYPLGLAIVIRYLGDPPSLRYAFAYFGGAAAVTVGAGAAILVSLRVAALPPRQERVLSAGLEVFLGVALLLVAFWIARHRATAIRRPPRRVTPRAREPAEPKGDHASTPKKTAGGRGTGSVRTVFLVGMTTYLPSALYVAALKSLADSGLGWGAALASLFVCASLVLLMVELPILLRLLAPRRTGQIIGGYNTWMNRHGWDVVLLLALVSGLYFLASGIATFLAGD